MNTQVIFTFGKERWVVPCDEDMNTLENHIEEQLYILWELSPVNIYAWRFNLLQKGHTKFCYGTIEDMYDVIVTRESDCVKVEVLEV